MRAVMTFPPMAHANALAEGKVTIVDGRAPLGAKSSDEKTAERSKDGKHQSRPGPGDVASIAARRLYDAT